MILILMSYVYDATVSQTAAVSFSSNIISWLTIQWKYIFDELFCDKLSQKNTKLTFISAVDLNKDIFNFGHLKL